MLWIRIRMDPELLPRTGSRIIVLDPDPAEYERADKIKMLFLIEFLTLCTGTVGLIV